MPLEHTLAIDRNVLEAVLARAADAARLVGHHDTLALGPLADDVDAVVHALSELLGAVRPARMPAARSTREQDVVTADPPERARRIDVAGEVCDLIQLIARAEALAHASEALFDAAPSVDDVEVRRRRERISHLLGAAAEAAAAALEAGNRLAVELANRRIGA